MLRVLLRLLPLRSRLAAETGIGWAAMPTSRSTHEPVSGMVTSPSHTRSLLAGAALRQTPPSIMEFLTGFESRLDKTKDYRSSKRRPANAMGSGNQDVYNAETNPL